MAPLEDTFSTVGYYWPILAVPDIFVSVSVVSMSLSVLTDGSAEVPCNITHIDSFVIKVIQIRVPCQNVQVSVNKVTLTDTWLYRIPHRIHATLCPHWQ